MDCLDLCLCSVGPRGPADPQGPRGFIGPQGPIGETGPVSGILNFADFFCFNAT